MAVCYLSHRPPLSSARPSVYPPPPPPSSFLGSPQQQVEGRTTQQNTTEEEEERNHDDPPQRDMKNPVNRLANAAPRALDSLLSSKTSSSSSSSSSSSNKDGMSSNRRQFHLEGLDLLGNYYSDGSVGGCGGSCATSSIVGFEDGGSVVDLFEDMSMSDFAAAASTSNSSATTTTTTTTTPSPN